MDKSHTEEEKEEDRVISRGEETTETAEGMGNGRGKIGEEKEI